VATVTTATKEAKRVIEESSFWTKRENVEMDWTGAMEYWAGLSRDTGPIQRGKPSESPESEKELDKMGAGLKVYE